MIARIQAGPAGEAPDEKTVMNDTTYLVTHRTLTSLRVKTGGLAA